MKKAKLFLSALSLFMAVGVFAQNMRVTGTVTDASTGEAVPYASLMVKGTLNGTSSDAEGNYSINVPSDGVLVFSAVGYVTIEEDVDGRARIDVALEPDSEFLDETIVVAYGVQKKSSFVGAADLRRTRARSMAKMPPPASTVTAAQPATVRFTAALLSIFSASSPAFAS